MPTSPSLKLTPNEMGCDCIMMGDSLTEKPEKRVDPGDKATRRGDSLGGGWRVKGLVRGRIASLSNRKMKTG